MTGGGIERALRITSAALTGRPSIRRSVKTDRNERFSAQRKRSVFSECRPLQRSGGGRAARVALQTPPGLRSSLRSIAPSWPLRLSPPLDCRDASGDESPDASLQRAGVAIGAVVRHRRGYGRRLMAPCGHPTYH